MQFTHKAGLALAAMTLLGLAVSHPAQAGVVGDIQAFYNAPNTFGVGVIDAPAFVFENTSGNAITGSAFTIDPGTASADTFTIGTIAGGGSFTLIPGQSNDGAAGHTFFAFLGGPLDTSDSGQDGDGISFQFTGLQNGVAISSGVFTAGASARPAGDGSVPSINFLGGPNDGPCNDCFDPTKVAVLSTPAVPEVSTVASLGLLLWLGAGGLLWNYCRRERKVE